MKWTGTGCTVNGQKQHDGGCQCLNYCGYQCSSACNRDSICLWANGACYNKQSGELGTPITSCSI